MFCRMEFDFLIMGAGSAGCVVANRLSADASSSIGLLEAGGPDNYPWIHIPVGYFKTMGNPKTDWCYKTEPDPGLNNRSLDWPRGKTLGGSSSINGLLYVRGQPQDFNHWRQLGNSGWSWEDVLPLFKRSESWEGQDDGIRGQEGPLTVSRNRVNRGIVDAWLAAAVAAGHKWTDDYNQEDQEGVGYFQMTMKGGRRCSSAVAYLNPVKHRKNLTVLTRAHTQRIIIKDGKAVGAEVRINGDVKIIRARKEIILCTGAIGSPQLLMLSGIGDGNELQDHGIETRYNLPGVGKNLQDHLQVRPIYKCDASTINTEKQNPLKLLGMAFQYAAMRSGPMAMAASLGTGFLKTHPDLETPDIQYHIQPFSADKIADGAHKFSAFTASVCQLRPESRGSISLKSSNSEDYPVIRPNYLSTKTDCDTIVAGLKITRSICQHEPVSSLITEEYEPGDAVEKNNYDSLLNWAREHGTTIYHPVGTCKMGNDAMAVVDNKLRVHGVSNLRVADASIMPTITSGNTNAPSIMIGEKLSDMVLATYKK